MDKRETSVSSCLKIILKYSTLFLQFDFFHVLLAGTEMLLIDLEMCRAVLGLQSDWMPSAVLGTQDTGTRSVWYSGQSFGMKNHLTQMPTLALLRNPGVQRGLASESQGREWTLNLLGPWWQKRMEVWLRSQHQQPTSSYSCSVSYEYFRIPYKCVR